jgi:outer membrane protein
LAQQVQATSMELATANGTGTATGSSFFHLTSQINKNCFAIIKKAFLEVNMNIKKISLLALISLCFSSGIFAQQITRFGVVDTAKVYQAYFRNSAPVRNYENKKAEFQREINKRTEEIQKLKTQKSEAASSGNETQASKLESDIIKKTDALSEYTNAKNMELESMKNNLQNSDSFYKKLYSTIERVAENEGFSMILSLQQNNAILWYSSSVDVTDKVISALGL